MFCVLFAASCSATDRFEALSQLESGNDDFTMGKAGEVSRFQIMPDIWRLNTSLPISRSTNYDASKFIAGKIQGERVRDFALHHNRLPTDREWALLWHCPGRVDRPTKGDADYAQRFINLLNRK